MKRLIHVGIVAALLLGLTFVNAGPAQAAGCTITRTTAGVNSCSYTPLSATGTVSLLVSNGTAKASVSCTFGASPVITRTGPGAGAAQFGPRAGTCTLFLLLTVEGIGGATAVAT